MSIIRCPGCGERVSSQAPHCSKCGYGIKDKEGGISLEEATARHKREKKYRLQYHSYFALVLLIVGALIMWFDYDADGETSRYSLMVVVAGAGWYLIARGRMLWDKRRK
jgi:predicted nucleic acid-binding Zn ribbon protein